MINTRKKECKADMNPKKNHFADNNFFFYYPGYSYGAGFFCCKDEPLRTGAL